VRALDGSLYIYTTDGVTPFTCRSTRDSSQVILEESVQDIIRLLEILPSFLRLQLFGGRVISARCASARRPQQTVLRYAHDEASTYVCTSSRPPVNAVVKDLVHVLVREWFGTEHLVQGRHLKRCTCLLFRGNDQQLITLSSDLQQTTHDLRVLPVRG
jgi:hypothetical protein